MNGSFAAYRSVGLAVLVSLFIGASLGWRVAPGAGDPAAAQDPELFVRYAQQARSSVLAVGSYDPQDTPSIRYFGTGFVVDDGHQLVTNAHVVEALRQAGRLGKLHVFSPDALPTQGRRAIVLAQDTHHDLALIQVEGSALRPLELDLSSPPAGRSVGVIGYPTGTALGLVPAVHRGCVAAVVPAVLPLPKGTVMTPELNDALRRPYDLYQLDLTVYPGNSGSPLLSAVDGRILGIINKTLAEKTREHLLDRPSGISYAVPSQWIDALLRRRGRERAGGPPTNPGETP